MCQKTAVPLALSLIACLLSIASSAMILYLYLSSSGNFPYLQETLSLKFGMKKGQFGMNYKCLHNNIKKVLCIYSL